jgi:hypothetical protein
MTIQNILPDKTKFDNIYGPCNKNDLIQTNPLRLQNATFRNCISIRISSTYIEKCQSWIINNVSRTNNDLLCIAQKTKDRETQTLLKIGGELRCSKKSSHPSVLLPT